MGVCEPGQDELLTRQLRRLQARGWRGLRDPCAGIDGVSKVKWAEGTKGWWQQLFFHVRGHSEHP